MEHIATPLVSARQASTPDPHLPALTGLRFVLAFWVVVHHLTGKGRMLDGFVSSLAEPLQRVVESGYVAVGTFFVLSGFVLARSYGSASWDRKSLLRYAVARYARVYPVYLLSLVILSPIILVQLSSSTPAVAEPMDRLTVLAQYGLVLQGWVGTLLVHWNTPAWSLSCELFFYLCFPLAIVFLRSLRWRGILSVAAATIALPWMLAAVGVPSAWKPLMHLGDFVVGIAAASAFESITRSPLNGRGYLLYIPAGVIALLLIAQPEVLKGICTLSVALRPLNVLLLIGLALGGGLGWRALATPSAIYLGKASYSLYILHIPLLWWYKRTWFYLSGAISSTVSAAIYISGAILVSALVWQRVEEPANRWIRRWAAVRLAGR